MVYRSVEGTPAEFNQVGRVVQRGANAPVETLGEPFPPASYDRAAMCTPPKNPNGGNGRGTFSIEGFSIPGSPALPEGSDLTLIHGMSEAKLRAVFARTGGLSKL